MVFGNLCEQCDHLRIGLLLRQVYRRVAGVVLKLRIRPVHYQHFYDICPPEHRGHHQSRLAGFVAGVHITLGGDQALCDPVSPLNATLCVPITSTRTYWR
jgi:hypothetical protein